MAKIKAFLSETFSSLPVLWGNFIQWLKADNWLRLAFGFACALFLAVIGQVVLSSKLGDILGAVLYLLASLLFVLVLSAAAKYPPPSEAEISTIRRSILPFVFGIVSLISILYVLPRVADDPRVLGWQNYYTLIAWVLSVISFCLAILLLSRWQMPDLRNFGQMLRENFWEILTVSGLFVLAFGLRVYRLEDFPYPFLKDESQLGLEALYVVWGQLTNLFRIGWAGDPLLSSLPEVLSIHLFGNTIFAVRFSSAVLGSLTVLILYLMTRDMFDKLTATLAALGLAAIPMHLHFSRMGVNNIIVGFWAVLIFWLTYRAIQKGRVSDYLLAGLVTGLPLYSYLGSRLISAIGALMLFYCVVFQRGYLQKYWRHLLVYGVVLILVVAPRFYGSPDMVAASFRTDNIFNNHWLMSEPVNSGRSMAAALFDQFYRSTFVFISVSAWGGFFNSPKPFLFPLAAVMFVFGLGYSIFRLRDLRYFLLQVWFWSIVFLGSVLYAVAPNAEKMVAGMPVAALLAAIGLAQVASLLSKMRLIPPRWVTGLAVAAMALTTFQGAQYYLVEYQQTRVFAHENEEIEQAVSLYVNSLGPNYELNFMINAPLRVDYFPARDFLIPETLFRDIQQVTPETIAALPRNKGQVFIATDARRAELATVERLLPGGEWREVWREPIPDWPRTILYLSYQVPPVTP